MSTELAFMDHLERSQMPLDHKMTYQELRDLDIRRGKAAMDWYRAMRARSKGEITWETMIEAEDRVKELDVELRQAMKTR
jgi:hypothetical protein